MTYNALILDAKERLETNGGDITEALAEYTNTTGSTIDGSGDVWDGRGYWWTDERKGKFCSWLDRWNRK